MSGTANQEELISQFADVAGIDSERSRFYLEAAGWELDLALASFYEADHEADEETGFSAANPQAVDSGSAAAAQFPSGMETLQGLIAQAAGAQAGREPTVPRKPKAESSSKPAARATGLATLSSIRNQEAEDDSSDEEEKRQSFYTGGSTTSGQQVLGPVKKEEFIKDLFQKAKEHGATADEPSSSSGPSKKKAGGPFGGAGFKLGDTTTVSFQSIPATPASPAQPESQEVTLRLWKAGFTVNNGELRDYRDPANQEFLNSIKRGEIPRELIRNFGGREVELAMEDRRNEDYAPPKVTANPFSGRGQMLGSPAPTVVGSTVNVTESDKATNETTAREQIALNESEPATNIQFRLADGSRLVARFNHTHTVNDLHNFINTARPQYSASNYILTLFPNTELAQRDVSVKDANLINAALTQKIK